MTVYTIVYILTSLATKTAYNENTSINYIFFAKKMIAEGVFSTIQVVACFNELWSWNQ